MVPLLPGSLAPEIDRLTLLVSRNFGILYFSSTGIVFTSSRDRLLRLMIRWRLNIE